MPKLTHDDNGKIIMPRDIISNEEELTKIFDTTVMNCKGDNVFQGLIIIAKYINPKEHTLITVGHDELFSVDIDDIIEAGITKEDATALAKLGWMLNEEVDCLSCFV